MSPPDMYSNISVITADQQITLMSYILLWPLHLIYHSLFLSYAVLNANAKLPEQMHSILNTLISSKEHNVNKVKRKIK